MSGFYSSIATHILANEAVGYAVRNCLYQTNNILRVLINSLS